MAKGMVYNEATGRMESTTGKKGTDLERIALDATLTGRLLAYAKADGYDLSGISYVTEKDASGKTKQGKDGKPVFVMVDGKKQTVVIAMSVAKAHSAIGEYVNIAVRQFIANREKLTNASNHDTPS